MRKLAIIIIPLLSICGCNTSRTIYNNVLDNPRNWVVEQQPGGKTIFANQSIEVIDAKGCTIWFKDKLEAPVKISYDIIIIDEGGEYDRVSDMNCMWMANDPKNPHDFFKGSDQRAGHFPNYHHFTSYYVGYGGHDNSKTRFRRYDGNVDRPLLSEHDLSDQKFMITANKKMRIEIVIKDGFTSYSRDGETIFEVHDPQSYTSGYFGFRTVENHMKIQNFKVQRI